MGSNSSKVWAGVGATKKRNVKSRMCAPTVAEVIVVEAATAVAVVIMAAAAEAGVTTAAAIVVVALATAVAAATMVAAAAAGVAAATVVTRRGRRCVIRVLWDSRDISGVLTGVGAPPQPTPTARQ